LNRCYAPLCAEFTFCAAAAFGYKLGNRSALEWVIEQYQVSTDKRSGISNDPNRLDDERYIVRLVSQVVYVSLETMKLVEQIAALPL
jgi:predicted helicase